MSMCPGVQRKRENLRNTHMRVPRVQRKKKKKKKEEKNPQKHAYACPEGAKKMVGVENACWGLKMRCWWLRHMAGVDNAWLGVENAW